MRAFADALDSVPMSLAENSGLSPIETLSSIKSRQVKENNSRLGVDCMQTGTNGKSGSSTPTMGVFPLMQDSKKKNRHEGTLRHRPLDWEAPATSTCDATLPDGAEGMKFSYSLFIRRSPIHGLIPYR